MRDNESVEMLIFGSQRFYLEPTQLERLKAHKYSAQGTSLLEPLMQPFWKWLVTKIPLWLAPNLITFIGLLINIFTTIPVLLLDQNAEGLAPSWSYITCAVGFFLYQSLDAIDGKQARRTGTNSPLGELFDHGCDAISVFLVVTSAISSVALHDNTLVMLGFIVLLMMLTFFYHWQTYVCGVLHFKLIDVTEAQFLHISLLLIAGLLGPDFWLNNVPFTDISLKLVLIVCVYATSLLNSIVALRIILTAGVGKNGSTVADTSVLSPSIILFFQVPVVFLYILYSPGPLNNNCMLFFSAMALPLVKSIIYLMIGSMTKSPLPLFDSIMLGPLLAFANVYLGTLLSEYYVLLVVLVYNIADITLMCILLCRQICICLDIHCFTIPSNPPKS